MTPIRRRFRRIGTDDSISSLHGLGLNGMQEADKLFAGPIPQNYDRYKRR